MTFKKIRIIKKNIITIQDEDDGIILSALVWGNERSNEVGLLILNAKNFKEIARITFNTPSSVPKCLHGWFISER